MEQSNNHILISDLSEEYTDALCNGNPDKSFCRGSIAAAYIIGAEETLQRISEVIRMSSLVGGLTPTQSGTLLRMIEDIENRPKAIATCRN